MILTVELNDEQTLALQLAQYRNGESLPHTLLRLAGLAPKPERCKELVYDLMSAQVQEDLKRVEDARFLRSLMEAQLSRRSSEGNGG